MAVNNLSKDLRQFLVLQGANLVGFADLGLLPQEVRHGLPYGISIAIALSPKIASSMDLGPTQEYKKEYDRINMKLGEITEAGAGFLENLGHKAVAKAATHSEIDWRSLSVPLAHKTIATLAGLGWIGKNALLVTRGFGTAIRLGTVLTDAVLDVGKPAKESKCGDCAECGWVCPGNAVKGKNWKQGLDRSEYFNAHACYGVTRRHEKQVGDLICGICIAACPWTKKWLKKP
ncbi:4Fe-4S double cluster binding domain-containing protein [Elusimicrobiota bacterium]